MVEKLSPLLFLRTILFDKEVIILNESTLSIIHKDGTSFFDFILNTRNAKPTLIEKNTADYWELEVTNDKDDFYAKFILDVT